MTRDAARSSDWRLVVWWEVPETGLTAPVAYGPYESEADARLDSALCAERGGTDIRIERGSVEWPVYPPECQRQISSSGSEGKGSPLSGLAENSGPDAAEPERMAPAPSEGRAPAAARRHDTEGLVFTDPAFDRAAAPVNGSAHIFALLAQEVRNLTERPEFSNYRVHVQTNDRRIVVTRDATKKHGPECRCGHWACEGYAARSHDRASRAHGEPAGGAPEISRDGRAGAPPSAHPPDGTCPNEYDE